MPIPLNENEAVLVFEKFYNGFSPAAHINPLTELGGPGHASVMVNADVLDPTMITQGPALANLTNGTQAGVVSELIRFILDRAVAADVTYGLGSTKLFKISSTTVASGGSPSWPRTITGAAAASTGQSCVEVKGNLYYFHNGAATGDIGKYDLSSTFDDGGGSTVPTTAATLQVAPPPSEGKEDIILFGNGRYVGKYTITSNTLEPTKLDFGTGSEVVDVIFHANQWWIAVNKGVSGTNRNKSQVYLYDGAAILTTLSDETAIGQQKIGFLYVVNGVVYLAYQDLTFTGGYKIGYVNGRSITPLVHFTGSLPNFQQKTLYKNTILFASSGLIYSAGSVIGDLPFQVSQIADGGYATVGALAAPFGTPMVASTDAGSNHRLAQFSGFDTACSWKSVVVQTIRGRKMFKPKYVVVLTKNLGAGASCALTIESNQAQSTSSTMTITTANKRRHVITRSIGLSLCEDLRITLDWAAGSASNDCGIRKVLVIGNFVEK